MANRERRQQTAYLFYLFCTEFLTSVCSFDLQVHSELRKRAVQGSVDAKPKPVIQELADAASRFRNQRPAGQPHPNEREKVEMTFKYALIRNIMVFVLFVLLHTLAQVSHLLLAMCCELDTCVLRYTCLCGVQFVCLACCVCVRSVLFSSVLRMQFWLSCLAWCSVSHVWLWCYIFTWADGCAEVCAGSVVQA